MQQSECTSLSKAGRAGPLGFLPLGGMHTASLWFTPALVLLPCVAGHISLLQEGLANIHMASVARVFACLCALSCYSLGLLAFGVR